MPTGAARRVSPVHPGLVADIGGTNARFAYVALPGGAIEHVRVLPVAAHAEPEAAVHAYLAEVQALLGTPISRRAGRPSPWPPRWQAIRSR